MSSDSIATITTTDTAAPVEVPAHPLSLVEAKILRVYAAWLSKRDLESRLWCPSCLVRRDTGMQIALDAEKVGMTCGHGLWFGFCPEASNLTTDHKRPESSPLIRELAAIEEVTLTQEEARLLQAYQYLLKTHHLREALYCLTCFMRNQDDGLRAFVKPHSIQLECRHRRLSYRSLAW
jgi:hypothetical protein